MSYGRLTPRQRQAVDLLMSGEHQARNRTAFLGGAMGVQSSTVKQILHQVTVKYGIESKQFIPSIRLVYMRAKELGLL